LVRDDGPFFTVLLPAPSHFPDSAHRLELEWRNARRRLGRGDRADIGEPPSADDVPWSEGELAVVDALLAAVHHDHGAAIAVVHAYRGGTHLELVDGPIHAATVTEGPLPRLAPIIESRQGALPHLVVEIDGTGADIVAFDGGGLVDDSAVAGERARVHRGNPGGWVQRRSRQRREHAEEHDVSDVAAVVTDLARRTEPALIATSGDGRAVSALVDRLDGRWRERVVELPAGEPGDVADEIVRRLADLVAGDIARLSNRLADAMATGKGCTGTDATLDALAAGQVAMLFVHDDRRDEDTTERPIAGFGAGVRVPDLAVALALRTGTDVVVVPQLAQLDGPLGGLLRW
jgi:hypothetical protein